MSLAALENLDDAVAVTKRFLLPFDGWRWAKLALVVFFVGVPGGNVLQFNASGGERIEPIAPTGVGPEFPAAVDERLIAIVAAIVLVGVIVAAIYLLVGSIMEFVLVESLRSDQVALRRFWARRWRQGLRLFGFRLLVGVIVLVPIGIAFGVVVLPRLRSGTMAAALGAVLLLLPLVAVLGVLAGLVSWFTTVFVVPVMIQSDSGVLAGWRRFWPTLRNHWKQYAAYAVAAFLLGAGAAVVIGVAMAGIVLLLLVPSAILAAIGFGLLAVAEPVGLAVLALTAVAVVIAVLAGLAFVGVPVVCYLRYYALLVLGDTHGDFDLIPDQRVAVRSPE